MPPREAKTIDGTTTQLAIPPSDHGISPVPRVDLARPDYRTAYRRSKRTSRRDHRNQRMIHRHLHDVSLRRQLALLMANVQGL